MPRAKVPSVISSNSSTIDTSALGTPTANWPTGGCDMNTFFAPQNIIFDITLCGGTYPPSTASLFARTSTLNSADFAKPPEIFSQTCSGVCYNDWVVGNGSNYATAYFEIASMRVFSKSGTNTVVGPQGKSTSASALTASSSGALMYAASLLSIGFGALLFD